MDVFVKRELFVKIEPFAYDVSFMKAASAYDELS
jgi:hypothetical protein